MAKLKKPSPKQIAAWSKAARGLTGRFLSKAEIALRDSEQIARLRDLAFMSPKQFAKHRRAELRFSEVKTEKIERAKRYRKAPAKYRRQKNPNKHTLKDADLINEGKLPKWKTKTKRGDLTEYTWEWQGHHALKTAQEFLLLSEESVPSDTLGYLAMGNGHGKNSQWIGTKMGTPREIWRHSQTFLRSNSETVEDIAHLAVYSDTARSLRAEVKLTTKGEINAEGKAKKKVVRKHR